MCCLFRSLVCGVFVLVVALVMVIRVFLLDRRVVLFGGVRCLFA